MEAEFTYVDSQVALESLVAHLRTVREVGIDTEADNLHHYHTRVCLIQISAGGVEFLIDSLAGLDLRPLFEVLADKLLIMHGSDYDLRLLWELCRFQPTGVFDTMLAAQLVGISRIGLSSLLSELLGVDHPKDSQKSDWSRRPLPPKMVQYAARDVKHIAELRDALLARLEDVGRVEWHRQKCAWQIEVATTGFPGTDENAWRIGPSRWLSPRAQAALYELWHWRDGEARRLDRPPFKVMSNDYLVQLAEAVDAGRWRDAYEMLPKGFRRGSARGLAEALERGESRDPKTLPRRPENGERRQPLSALELSRQDKIRAHRDRRSHELHIDPTLVASRSQIAQLARQPDSADQVLLPWQADLLRPVLETCLASW